MLTGSQPALGRAEWEDPLVHLSYKDLIEYRRGQIIFDENQGSRGIRLLVQGKVRVCRPSVEGVEVVIDIYQANELFGESGFLGAAGRGERATALLRSQVMFWDAAEIEQAIESRPQLGVALMRLLARRCADICSRLEGFAAEKTHQRVVRSLLHFAERFGTRSEDGAVHIPPMTHQLISEYVGTSREIVTFNMNQLRRQGYLRYSRKGIDLFADALKQQ
jgi:CRP/FNR family cyclic AMP-dependent transcriptional regulator